MKINSIYTLVLFSLVTANFAKQSKYSLVDIPLYLWSFLSDSFKKNTKLSMMSLDESFSLSYSFSLTICANIE